MASAVPVPRPKSRALTYVLLAVVVILFGPCCIGVVAAIAIPNFIKFQTRSKQAECKTNLKAIYTAERAYQIEHERYSTRVKEIGFQPERKNRYAYFVGLEGSVENRSHEPASGADTDTVIGVDERSGAPGVVAHQLPNAFAGGSKVGLSGQCPKCEVTAVCAGNLDSDPVLDIWSISTQDRTGPNGEAIAAGEPYHDSDDATDLSSLIPQPADDSDAETDSQTFQSKDGLTQLTVPLDWTERTDLNKAATLQAAGPSDAYVIVISEKREDFANSLDLRGYAKITTTQFMKRLHGSPKKTEPKDLEVDGDPAIRFEVTGEIDALKIRYLHTVVQTETHFHRIIAWSKASKFEDNRALFESIADTFAENTDD